MIEVCFKSPGNVIKQITVFSVILVGSVLANCEYYTFNFAINFYKVNDSINKVGVKNRLGKRKEIPKIN